MNKFFINNLLVLVLMLVAQKAFSQNLYDVNTLQKIEITFSQANWDYQMDTAKRGAEGYLMASQVKINGTSFDSVAVKYKGNSSFDSSKIKNPLHINLGKYKNQKYQTYTDIKLSNGYGDPSLMREVMAYAILGNYMHCPKSNFVQLYINGDYIGVYSSDEAIDKKFCADHFYSSDNTFIKCNPIVNPGPTTKSNFKYINNDTSSYSQYYEIKSDIGWADLVKLCDSVTNNPSSLDNVVDMDRVIWMLAFNNLLINLDSYSGVFAQNHYSYKDNTGHFNPIVWDLNMAFGAFPFAGSGGTSMGSLTISGEQQFPLNSHASDTFWPLINAVQANPTYKRKYIAHMRTMLNEYFANNAYETLAAQLKSTIDTAVQSDSHKFFTNLQFQNAMDSSAQMGTYYVPGIKQLMATRVTYLQSTPEFTATTPIISSIATSTTNPIYNSVFTLTANVINTSTSNVWLGYRFDKTLKFLKVNMYDDGAHNDGAANDNVYGADITMLGGQMQYYIYAENADAGIFSPERAEHEFHILNAASSTPTVGNLVINELLAENSTNVKDEYNDREDWIELYNNSNQLLNISDVYLSDDVTNLMKWKFPSSTSILPNGFLTIWADDDSSQQVLHTNFNLNKDSGKLMMSNGAGQILDSISFATQTADVSFGRYPNGTGNFAFMNTTYGSYNTNYPLQVTSVYGDDGFEMYPNPATQKVFIKSNTNQTIAVYSIQGRKIFETNADNHLVTINVSNWTSGMYFVKSGNKTHKLIVQ